MSRTGCDANQSVIPMLRYRVAAARKACGLTRAQLARRLEIRTCLVADWEEGIQEPAPQQITRLAHILSPTFGNAKVWLKPDRYSSKRMVGSKPRFEGRSPESMSDAIRVYRHIRTNW